VNFYDPAGTYTADNDLIKYVGRTEASGTTRIINIGTSGFEVAFYGTTLKMNMNSVNSPYIPVGDGDGACRFSVFVDGETNPSAQTLVVKTATNGDYTIVSFSEPGYHRVRLQRQSEARYASTTLVNLQVVGGGLLPVPASKALKIEAFGDSITAGVGAMRAPGVADGLVFATDSGLHTYAGLAAASLGAEYSAMAVAGAGLCDTPMDSHNPNYFLKNFYNRVAFEKTTVFPAAEYTPDAVVINIGTNDLNSQARYEESEYKATYIQLVKNLAARYEGHDVTFFLCSGLMDNILEPVIEDIVDALEAEGISAVAVRFNKAANGHPNAVEHEAASAVLAAAIREAFGIVD
jgi:lysophospholipase L1-like esterase